jgi:hypothetical protein
MVASPAMMMLVRMASSDREGVMTWQARRVGRCGDRLGSAV